jgi:hypothetical protein
LPMCSPSRNWVHSFYSGNFLWEHISESEFTTNMLELGAVFSYKNRTCLSCLRRPSHSMLGLMKMAKVRASSLKRKVQCQMTPQFPSLESPIPSPKS